MKKYKLIKLFPGSPSKLGHIVEFPNDRDFEYYSQNPEFWELVVEPDYEILSYVKKDRPACVTTKKRGGTRHDEFWNIRVVKRLSDGEIFKIGDIIKTNENGRKHQIDSISLANGKDSLKQGIWIHYVGGSQHISNTIKAKDKLFTTENGVDIYNGDIYWFVNNYELDYAHADFFSGNSSSIKYFSTKEAADAYMLNNKPCLSLDDIRRSLSLTTPQINELVRLIKAKL